MPHILGIDQGTTQTTAVVVDDRGQVLATRSAKITAHYPRPGWVEQDPLEILSSVREAAQSLIEQFPIAAVGFDNQGETFLLWDAATGEPRTPAIVWQDKRGQSICERLSSSVDTDWLRRKTGLVLDGYFSAPKLRFVLENDAQLRADAAAGRLRFGTTESWVLWNLSGGKLHVTDSSTASRTLLFDINRCEWDEELLALFGLPRCLLPEVRPSAGFVGEIDLGAGEPLPLHALLADQQAALLGQACIAPGDMKCTLGTGAFLLMNAGSSPRFSNHGLLTTVAWHWPGQTTYALDGGIFTVGSAVQWLTESLRLVPDVAASADIARLSTDLGVTFVPALQGLAAPHWRSDARGAILGLSRGSTAADIVRATLDGIACRIVEVVHAMAADAGRAPTRLKVDGGPAANPYLMQVLADLLNLEIVVAAEFESTAIGIASLAAHSAFGISLDQLASRWRSRATFSPMMSEPERARRWERWQSAVDAVKRFHGHGS